MHREESSSLDDKQDNEFAPKISRHHWTTCKIIYAKRRSKIKSYMKPKLIFKYKNGGVATQENESGRGKLMNLNNKTVSVQQKESD